MFHFQLFDPSGSSDVPAKPSRVKPMMNADFDLVENQLQNDLNQQMATRTHFAG